MKLTQAARNFQGLVELEVHGERTAVFVGNTKAF